MGRFIINSDEVIQAEKILQPLSWEKLFDENQKEEVTEEAFSLWLEERLFEKLKKHKEYQSLSCVFLGSVSRKELSPCSDIDLLISSNDSAKVSQYLVKLSQEKLPIRQRVVSDSHWHMEDLEVFDWLSFLRAQPLLKHDDSINKKIADEKEKLKKRRKVILSAIYKDRLSRVARYDSIVNYLQPNIKYGPGGLRDIQLSLDVLFLFPEKFVDFPWIEETLKRYKRIFLNVRHKLHLETRGEILTPVVQVTLAQWYGFSEIEDFMKEVQKGLSQINFYTNLVFDIARRSIKAQGDYISHLSVKEAYAKIMKDQSYLNCFQILRSSNRWVSKDKPWGLFKRMVRDFKQDDLTEKKVKALFLSEWLHYFIKDLKRVRGFVQHDQYHRYTLDAHILLILLYVVRVKNKGKTLGKLSFVTKGFKDRDWEILFLSALFHDLGKGLKGSHSVVGAKKVNSVLKDSGVSLNVIKEVEWLVKNHLVLSASAFRKNPHDPKTWKHLNERGLTESRLMRLTALTVIDILATNKEAWNRWKEKLLFDLVTILSSDYVSRYQKIHQWMKKKNIKIKKGFLDQLDPVILTEIKPQVLIRDYQALSFLKENLPVLFIKKSDGNYWVRFHHRTNVEGYFNSVVSQLYVLGCNIEECYVQTFDRFGIYDWFRFTTSKPLTVLKKQMKNMSPMQMKKTKVKFPSISLLSESEEEVVVSFRGYDQKGALMVLSDFFNENKVGIQWVKVMKWGRRVEDIFSLDPIAFKEVGLEGLRETFLSNS